MVVEKAFISGVMSNINNYNNHDYFINNIIYIYVYIYKCHNNDNIIKIIKKLKMCNKNRNILPFANRICQIVKKFRKYCTNFVQCNSSMSKCY